ncbi:ribosome biogenesis protein NOP53-like [Styela clava]
MINFEKNMSQKAKKRRLNKNKKKTWRKNIDISDVEKALDIERLELRTGGLVSEKADDELFFVDKSAKTENKSKRSLKRDKRLHVDETLVPDPNAIKPPSTTSNRSKRRAVKRLDKKLERRNKIPKTGVPLSEDAPFDLWANQSLDLYDIANKKTEIAKYTDIIIGERQVKRPKHLENKPNDVERYKYRTVPAVEIAHPGASYNPTYTDHQSLLSQAYQVELNKLKVAEKVQRSLHVPYEQLPDLDTYQKEMQEGLFGSNDDHEDFVDGSTAEGIMANAPVRANDRKTRRKRKMEEKEKMEKRQKEKVWGAKLRENEVFRTKTFLAEIRAKERKLATRRELRKKKLRLLTLSNVKFTEQDIELKLSDEIKGSLRELKPESGVLTDRYKSFQKRGIVEPRCKRNIPKRKYKIRYQEKRQWREIEA